MNIVAFLALFLIFWTDKFLVLRHYKKPPLFDSGLNDRILDILPVAIFIGKDQARAVDPAVLFGSEVDFRADFFARLDFER